MTDNTYKKNEEFIRIENISKKFRNKTVLNSISLDIKKGEIISLAGKSGYGKSTLIKILVGFYNSDFGKIYYNRRDITKK